MKNKIGFITIGQSPRDYVVPEMKTLLNEKIEIIEQGALNGLTRSQIESVMPEVGDEILVSKLTDGSFVRFSRTYILPKLQSGITQLEKDGAQLIVIICSGDFPEPFNANVPIIYPSKILTSVVSSLFESGSIGIIIPEADQVNQTKEKWHDIKELHILSGSPYKSISEIEDAAFKLKAHKPDLIVMDCIGYDFNMRRVVHEITDLPVMSTRTIVSRVLDEILGGY